MIEVSFKKIQCGVQYVCGFFLLLLCTFNINSKGAMTSWAHSYVLFIMSVSKCHYVTDICLKSPGVNIPS